jgi:hypothetical protein
MKLIAVDERIHDYLLHVFEAYTRAGIVPGELGLAAEAYQHLVQARDIPIDQLLSQAKVAEVGPNGVALEVELPETKL